MTEQRPRLSIGSKSTLFLFVSGFISSVLIWIFLQQKVITEPTWMFLAVLSISLGVAGGVGWYLNRGLQADFRALMGAARTISRGELTHEIERRPKRFADEVDDLTDIFSEMQDNLRNLVGQIQRTGRKVTNAAHNLSATAEQMTGSTHEIASTMADISRGTDNQSRLVDQTSNGMRDVVRAIEQTQGSARESADRATESVEAVHESSQLAHQAVEKMQEIFDRVEDSSRLMVAFSDKLKQVSKIVVVISGIAQKTTLLSLNATIEAAKAGEYGRGFAVVADEIRKLAESTTRSAEQITELIEGVDQESRRVLEAMQGSVDVVSKSRSDVTTVGDSLDGIVSSFKEIQLQTLGISDLAQAQTVQSQQILRAMEEIQKVAENTAAATMEISASTSQQTESMQEMSSAAMELSKLAEDLKAATTRFQLDEQEESEVSVAIEI